MQIFHIRNIFLFLFLCVFPFNAIAQIYSPSGGTVTSVVAGTGLSGGTITSTGTLNSNAEQTINFQPGLLATIVNTKGNCIKFVKATTVDNIEATAITFSTCSPNPAVSIYECGVSSTCASSPTTIGTVTVTAAGTIVDGTVSSPTISAGDYVCFAISAGTCVAINISLSAQVHSN